VSARVHGLISIVRINGKSHRCIPPRHSWKIWRIAARESFTRTWILTSDLCRAVRFTIIPLALRDEHYRGGDLSSLFACSVRDAPLYFVRAIAPYPKHKVYRRCKVLPKQYSILSVRKIWFFSMKTNKTQSFKKSIESVSSFILSLFFYYLSICPIKHSCTIYVWMLICISCI